MSGAFFSVVSGCFHWFINYLSGQQFVVAFLALRVISPAEMWCDANAADFSNAITIDSAADGAIGVYVADVDGDSQLDVLAALFNDDAIMWYRNTDGKGSFSEGNAILSINSPRSVFAGDITSDSFTDVVAGSGSLYHSYGTSAWYKNMDGEGES